jgi:GGDEF domain-containing protein
MLNIRRSASHEPKRLPKQADLPTRMQLRSLFLEADKDVNCLVELPFGDPPEIYSLAVLRERPGSPCQWSLYRGERANSALEWNHSTNDWEQIHSLISAQFPGWDLKGKFPVEKGQDITKNSNDVKESREGSSFNSTLEGDLRNLQIPNLLQSVAMGEMTGRLQIRGRADTAMVFFVKGQPVHCTMKGATGEGALVQLISWEDGQFCFYPEPKIETKTINKRLEFLIMEGVTFLDQSKSLSSKGLNLDSIIVRTHESITEQEFEEIVAKGTGHDISAQKQFYCEIDNESTLFEILRNQPMSKTAWVPILFNFVNLGLVEFKGKQSLSSHFTDQVSTIDWSQMRMAERALLRSDTGLYTFPAFLYFLDKEYWRCNRFNRPFSIIILKIGLVTNETLARGIEADIDKITPLPIRAIRALGQNVSNIKRQIDVLAHFETLNYALLLPETNQNGVSGFMDRLSDLLKNSSFEDIESNYVDFAMGGASMPEDCADIQSLINTAQTRMQSSQAQPS